MELRAHIAEEIRRRGPIPFSRYMELCLYHPELGYYSRAREAFGKHGDFYTSSDVHAVFGRLLARQFDEMWRALGAPSCIALVELGPGRGLFAQDVLDWSQKKFPDFLDALQYVLVEQSARLRLRLQERFAERKDKVTVVGSLEEWTNPAENAIVFANEFFDALPVEVIGSEGELAIGIEGDRLVECWVAPSGEALEFLDRYGVHPRAGEGQRHHGRAPRQPGTRQPAGASPAGSGQAQDGGAEWPGERVEATLAAVDYVRQLAAKMPRGFIVAVDYGYTREELLAGRSGNTVRAFRHHTLSPTVYDAPGEQDMTASVNFTALRAAAVEAGMEAGDLVTQAEFLIGIGEANQFADAFEDTLLPQERAKVTLQLKHLVTPAGLGEIFQVLVLRRGVEREKALKLAGLRYARR